jgi:plasmid replication initiation protein
MKEKDKEVVRYNNDLNNKTYLKNFNALELNFFMAICSKLKTQGTDEVIFTFNELKKKIQYDRETTRNTDNFISKLRSTNRKILNSICEIETKDYIDQFVLFPTFRISKKTGTLTVRINQDYAYLLNDFSNFTEFGLANFIKLSSKYVKLLYKELMQFRSTGKLYLTMEDFRKKLDIPNSYSFSKIKDRILVPSIQDFSFIFKKFKIVVIYNNEDEVEINENTEEKRGDKRKVTNINFYFVLGTKEDIIEVPVSKEILKDKLEANTEEEIDIKEEERLFNLDSIKCGLDMQISITEEEIETEKSKIERYKQYIKQTREAGAIDSVDEVINRDIISHYEFCIKEALEKIRSLEAKIIENKEEIEKIENEIGCNQVVSNQSSNDDNNDKKDIENKEEIDYLKLIKEFLKGQGIDYKKVETNINFLLENYTSEEIYREIIRINNIKSEKANKNPVKYLITSINNIEKIKNDCKQDESIKTSYINIDEAEEVKNKGLINLFEFEEE